MTKTVWMFAGQGAQYYQMGRELYEREPVFRDIMERGDRLVVDLINQSLIEVIFCPRVDRFEPFRRLLYTHPALFLFECANAEMLKRKGLQPDYLLGYSLGEYACLVVAESVSFEEALVAVTKQAELIEYCAPPGGMLAVLGPSDLAAQYPEAFRECTISAYNFPRNFVVSAPQHALTRLRRFLQPKGINSVELPLDYPFHWPPIEAVRTALESIASQLSISAPKIPIVSATQGRVLDAPSANHLWNVIRQPIDLARTIEQLESSGPYLYVDLGPSGSMATAIKYNVSKNSKSEFFTLASPFGHESRNLENLLEKRTGG